MKNKVALKITKKLKRRRLDYLLILLLILILHSFKEEAFNLMWS